MRVSLRAIGLRAKACALRDVREKSLNYDNGADIMRSNEAIKGWRRQWRWRRRASVDGIDGRCRCCGVARVTRPRVVLVLLATEPSRTSMGRSMCRGRYSACSGYNCRWWAAVALGGPVSINQPALNTRPRPLARGIARLAGRSQLPRMRFARTIYVSRRIVESMREPALARATRQNIIFTADRIARPSRPSFL